MTMKWQIVEEDKSSLHCISYRKTVSQWPTTVFENLFTFKHLTGQG